MTQDQIDIYKKCEKHLNDIDEYIKKIPFNIQKYGCGSGSPRIDFTLDNIHAEMYVSVISAMEKAKSKIEKIVKEL